MKRVTEAAFRLSKDIQIHRMLGLTRLFAVHRSSSPGFSLHHAIPVHQMWSGFPRHVPASAHDSRQVL